MTNGPLPPLSDLQIAASARRKGFTGQGLLTIIAVSLAESGGDPDNVGDESLQDAKWGPSVGLTQVRCLRNQIGTGQTRDCSRLADADFNMGSAYAISAGGTNFKPWSMFTNGQYKAFLDRARAAVAGMSTGANPASPDSLVGGIFPGGGLVEKVTDPLLRGFARIALVGVFVAGGVALVAAGGWQAGAGGRARLANMKADVAQKAGMG